MPFLSTRPYGRFKGGLPAGRAAAAVFYPFGQPTPYAYAEDVKLPLFDHFAAPQCGYEKSNTHVVWFFFFFLSVCGQLFPSA
jgi:hypothetical protein